MTTKKKYPDSKHVSLILCEDIREEKNGKQTLTGVVTGDLILKRKGRPDKPSALRAPQFALFVRALGLGEGTYTVGFKLIPPSEEVILKMDPSPTAIDQRPFQSVTSLVLNVRAHGMPMEVGVYRWELSIDSEIYFDTFNVVAVDPSELNETPDTPAA